MANLTRDLWVPLLDSTFGAEKGTYTWVRIDKSTIFDFGFNPEEEDQQFIDTKTNSSFVKSYSLELPEEIILDSDNPLYKMMDEYIWSLPTGQDAIIPFMLVRPDVSTGKATVAMVWDDTTVIPTNVNTQDGKLSFSIKPSGDAQVGTASESDGTWTFSPGA